ncbi:MAG: T9SS type A sorting domain-containing protein [Bacteroidota bacterium]
MRNYYTYTSICGKLLIWMGMFALVSCQQAPEKDTSPTYLYPDGPDRAQVQNLYMIEDRQTNTYPFERLTQVRQQLAREENASKRNTNFQWQQISTKTPGRSRALLYHTPSGTVFTGSVSGGLWKNPNYKQNASWEQVNGFEGSAVNCLAADPANENIIYLGTGESFTAFVNYRESTGLGTGIYRSRDAGESWELLSSTAPFYYVNDLVVRVENGTSVIYAAVGSGEYETRSFVGEGLYRSRDNGGRWEQVLPLIPGTDATYQAADIEIAGDVIYVSTMRNSENDGGSILLSSTDGENWNVVTDEFNSSWEEDGFFPGRALIKHAPSNPAHLYFLFTVGLTNDLNQLRDYATYLYQSIDAGSTWSSVALPRGGFNIPWHAMSLAVDPANEHKVLTGGLNLYALSDASSSTVSQGDWVRLSEWSRWYRENLPERYVHGDLHDVQFIQGSSDELLISTDGGIYFTENLSLSDQINPQNPVQEFPAFDGLYEGLNTTQYYHAAIHPREGVSVALGGTQDNGSIYRDFADNKPTEDWVSGGDGGFNFFDSDDGNLLITMIYGNRYFIHRPDTVYFVNDVVNGLFVNPVVYDDVSNLLYSNPATSAYGGLYASLSGRYYDTLQVLNVNPYLGKDDLGLDDVSFLPLNVGLREAITALQLTKPANSLVFGTENGKVYSVSGIPNTANTTRIDNGQLPNGYISSIDIGSDPNHIMLTFSNFGIASVWATSDGGSSWTNLERNLADMPVRWGRFDPANDDRVLIATEIGIWGLESITDEATQWTDHNDGLPPMRVDMFDLRACDATILAATHGQGLFVGKYTDEVPESCGPSVFAEGIFYPNPVSSTLFLPDDVQITRVEVYDLKGAKVVDLSTSPGENIDLSNLGQGVYIVRGFNENNTPQVIQKVLKQ